MLKTLFRLSVLAASLAAAYPALAVTLKEAAQEAVLRNPDVQNRWHIFKAASENIEVAKAGYRPKLDARAAISRERYEYDDPARPDRDYTGRGFGLYLTQMIYDGFATSSEVERLSYAQRVRYFEFVEASENAALLASKAYNDVLRYRKLYKLTEQNYIQHRVVFEQMQQRVKNNVGRRVDLEQASGRLALAEANLLTEASNLHDVSSRYQRIVGKLPPASMDEPAYLKKGIPAATNDVILAAYENSPSLAAAQENILAAQGAVKTAKSRFHPQLYLQASRSWGWNDQYYNDETVHDSIGLQLNYNIYNGGADTATEHRYLYELNAAKDNRDTVCRDVRQSVAIANSDLKKLAEKLAYLDQHQLATEKARDAYRLQFNVGQRTLLDLLDTENELFEARRAYIDGYHDYIQAHANVQANLGNLLVALGLQRLETPELSEAKEKAVFDPKTICPPEDAEVVTVDKDKLYADAIAENPDLLRQPMLEDGDDDGVSDAKDKCLNTPPNTPVGPDGCEMPAAPKAVK
ncbi:MAG: TolC family outer membrane protein [Thiobacillus sp.]|nr:TolC family outer membrane protein [Thiobacillus sp.]